MSSATSSASAGAPSLGSRLVGSPLLRLILKRLLMVIPIMFGVTVLTFWVMSLIPGNAAQQILGVEATQEQIDRFNAERGLDRPGYVRYFSWLGGVVTGDFGRSIVSGQSVTDLLAERGPVTFELVLLAFVLSLVVAIPIALLSARYPDSILDRAVMLLCVTGLAVANYVLALLLMLIFAVQLQVLPAIGYVPFGEDPVGNLTSMILPTLAIAIPLACFYIRFLRSDIVDQLNGQDYIDTARAKGVGPWRILLTHAFRNSSFGLLTLVGLNIGALVGGTVIIEQIFALPGIGQLMLQSINARDTTVVLNCVVIFAFVAVIANLVVDIMYAVLDPRIRHDSH